MTASVRRLLVFTTVLCFTASAWAQTPDPVEQALSLEQQGDLAGAVRVYQEALALPSNRARAPELRVRLGNVLEKSGQAESALAAYAAALPRNYASYWHQRALFSRARLCLSAGCRTEALDDIGRLKYEFPDSMFAVQAEVLEAQAMGGATAAAEERVRRETEANELLKNANALPETEALPILQGVANQYADLPAGLRALDTSGHLKIRLKQRAGAAADFETLLSRLQATPQAKLLDRVGLRMAALKHRKGEREKSIETYTPLASSQNSSVRSIARLQLAGLWFELLQRRVNTANAPSATDWRLLDDALQAITTDTTATPAQQARAGLMLIESFAWQKRFNEGVAAGEQFIARFGGNRAYVKEVATAQSFVADQLISQKRWGDAIPHFRAVIAASPDGKEFWGSVKLLPHAYFRIYEALTHTGAPREEIDAAAEAVIAKYPDSSYGRFLKAVRKHQ